MEIYSAPSAQVIYQQFRKTCLPRRAIRINRAVPCVSSRDSLDWKDYGISSIIDTVTNHKHLGNGSIILCHNGAKYTAEALDTLITALEEKSYELVKISELIYRDGYTMDVEGRQIPGAGAKNQAGAADNGSKPQTADNSAGSDKKTQTANGSADTGEKPQSAD